MIASAPRILGLATAFVAVLLLGVAAAQAQRRAPQPQPLPEQQSPVETPAPPAKPENPGLIHELGKLLGKPGDLFPSLKPSPDAATSVAPPDDATTAAPARASPVVAPAPAPPIVAIPEPAPAPPPPPSTARVPQMVTGRSSCPFAANGAPDCKTGADLLCKAKGFTSGSSLDMDSSHNCSKEALLAGARTLKDICRTETFVTRAMCQ